MQGTVVSVQVGRIETCSAEKKKTWTTAIRKLPVAGPVGIGRAGLAHDQQADRIHHGGPDKAVLAYSAEHYPRWADELPELDMRPGGFGENLTIAGLDETVCCIGDVLQVGDCRLQISQPRQPCWKLSRRWNLPKLEKLVRQTGRTGWYLRVLDEGEIAAGMEIRRVEQPFPGLTVAWALGVMYAKPRNREDDLRLADCPALAESWRQALAARAAPKTERRESAGG